MSEKKRKFIIKIWFQSDENGKLYELESIKLKTKLITLAAAKKLAIAEAEKCWPHYEIEMTAPLSRRLMRF